MKIRTLRMLASCAVLAIIARSAKAADLEFQWDAASDPTVIGYVIEYGTRSGTYTHEIDVGNTRHRTIGGLSAGATYYFVVRSYDAAGVFSVASEELVATAAPVPATPTITSLTITSQVAPPQPVNTMVQWTATPAGGVTPYHFRWFIFDGEHWWPLGGWTAAATIAWQPTLANDRYVVGVWARSAGSTIDAPELSVLQPFAIAAAAPAAAIAPSTGPALIDAVAGASIARSIQSNRIRWPVR